MKRQTRIGLLFITPALISVVFFFLLPVVMTAVFAFTNMSTSTGVKGGAYVLTQPDLRMLADSGVPSETLDLLENAGYVIDDTGLAAMAETVDQRTADELRDDHFGERFDSRRNVERVLRELRDNPIRSTRDRKAAADLFKKSVLNERVDTEPAFRALLANGGIPEPDHDQLTAAAYTGWTWTTENFSLLFSLPSTWRFALNSFVYVTLTLSFNVLFGLFLALSTFYLPSGQAATFRTIWFLPRILPPVMYVLMWKWLTWDTGFIATVTGWFGAAPRNWMMDTSYHAWTTVVLINGFVGASMGMILFSSAIRAIPSSMLYASEVDGANRWQQIKWIILPQLRWPILFVTAYQTLSLLTSFEYILLSTEGGPGSTTEVWALAAFNIALNNYGGNLLYGLGATFALVLVIIGIVASLAYLRLFNFNALLAKPRIEE